MARIFGLIASSLVLVAVTCIFSVMFLWFLTPLDSSFGWRVGEFLVYYSYGLIVPVAGNNPMDIGAVPFGLGLMSILVSVFGYITLCHISELFATAKSTILGRG